MDHAQCFTIKGSELPICGVHNVQLIRVTVSIDRNAPGLGSVICFRCPISQAVISDGPNDLIQRPH